MPQDTDDKPAEYTPDPPIERPCIICHAEHSGPHEVCFACQQFIADHDGDYQ